jgi:hypothetical protein
MKIAIAVLAFVAAAVAIEAGPIEAGNITVNIVTIEVNANAVIDSNIETNIITVLFALLNQQAAIINGDVPEGIVPTEEEHAENPLAALLKHISPEMIANVKNVEVTPKLIEKVKSFVNKA